MGVFTPTPLVRAGGARASGAARGVRVKLLKKVRHCPSDRWKNESVQGRTDGGEKDVSAEIVVVCNTSGSGSNAATACIEPPSSTETRYRTRESDRRETGGYEQWSAKRGQKAQDIKGSRTKNQKNSKQK